MQGLLGKPVGDLKCLKPTTNGEEGDDWSDIDDQDDEAAGEWPENMTLAMPSSLGYEQCQMLGLQALRKQEIELRIGQLNDCLENLRVALGHKIILFKTGVRNSKSQQTKTRAWTDVGRVDRKIKKITRNYNQARHAILRLGAFEDTLQNYREINADDLKVSGDIVEENRIGQRNEKISWIWRFGRGVQENHWIDECKPLGKTRRTADH